MIRSITVRLRLQYEQIFYREEFALAVYPDKFLGVYPGKLLSVNNIYTAQDRKRLIGIDDKKV